MCANMLWHLGHIRHHRSYVMALWGEDWGNRYSAADTKARSVCANCQSTAIVTAKCQSPFDQQSPIAVADRSRRSAIVIAVAPARLFLVLPITSTTFHPTIAMLASIRPSSRARSRNSMERRRCSNQRMRGLCRRSGSPIASSRHGPSAALSH